MLFSNCNSISQSATVIYSAVYSVMVIFMPYSRMCSEVELQLLWES